MLHYEQCYVPEGIKFKIVLCILTILNCIRTANKIFKKKIPLIYL